MMPLNYIWSANIINWAATPTTSTYHCIRIESAFTRGVTTVCGRTSAESYLMSCQIKFICHTNNMSNTSHTRVIRCTTTFRLEIKFRIAKGAINWAGFMGPKTVKHNIVIIIYFTLLVKKRVPAILVLYEWKLLFFLKKAVRFQNLTKRHREHGTFGKPCVNNI